MLSSAWKLTPSFLSHLLPATVTETSPEDYVPSAVKIIHAGGLVEWYYMAIPAAGILKKYPSYLLARPEIFRRPWDSLVRPEEILTPGEKFYVVPRQTVHKLRRQVRRNDGRVLEDERGVLPGRSTSWETDEREIAGGMGSAGKREKGGQVLGKGKVGQKADAARRRRRVRKMVMWVPTLEVIRES